MKEGLFKMMKLNDFSRITYGYTEKSKENASKYKYLRITDIQNSSVNWDNVPFCDIQDEPFKKYELKKGDLVFARTGATTGKSFLINSCPPAVYASYLIRVQINNSQIFENYIQYYFQSQSYWNEIAGGISGSAQGGFNAKKLGDLEIPIPPLSEQKAIVEKLDFAFEAIEKAKANIEKNIENAKELFQSKLFSIFQKGENNYNYIEKKFENICVLQRGFDLPTRLREKGNFPLVSSNGITDYVSNFKVKGPGVTTGRSGTIGKVHFIEKDFWPLNTSLYIKEFHGNNERFIYYFLQSVDITKYGSGAGVPTLNRNFIHSELFKVIEDFNSQCEIVKILDQLNLKTNLLQEKYKQKLANLEELKKSILEKAFKGELIK